MSEIIYKHNGNIFHITEVNTQSDFDKIASDILTTSKYPLPVRQEVGKQLLQIAHNYTTDTDTHKKLEKTAGWGTSTTDHVYDTVRNRALLLYKKDHDLSDKLQKLAKTLQDNYKYTLPQDVLNKTASFVDMVDRATDLHKYYDKGLNRPEDDMYRYTLTDGKHLKKYAVNMKNDKVLTSTAIESNFDNIRDVMSDAFGIQISNVKEAVDKLADLDSKQADIIMKAALEQ